MIRKITLQETFIYAQSRDIIRGSPGTVHFSDGSYITLEDNELRLCYPDDIEVEYECKVYLNGGWVHRGPGTLETAKKEVEKYQAEGKTALLVKHTSEVVKG
jgi:hypothetical protein